MKATNTKRRRTTAAAAALAILRTIPKKAIKTACGVVLLCAFVLLLGFAGTVEHGGSLAAFVGQSLGCLAAICGAGFVYNAIM